MDTYVACTNCNKINRVQLENIGKGPKCGNCGSDLKFHGYASEASAAGLNLLIKKSPIPVVVDFWAPWCAPCRSFAPVFEAASKQMGGVVNFVKVNTEEYPLAGDMFGIRGIPTIAMFSGGIERDRISGALPLDAFSNWLQAKLSAR